MSARVDRSPRRSSATRLVLRTALAAAVLAACAETDTDGGASAPSSAPGSPVTSGSSSSGGEPDRGGDRVSTVVDGDTVDVVRSTGVVERVRLVGINAPERGECVSEAATAAMAELVGGRSVRLVRDRTDRDEYGRLLRYVEVDGVDAGLELVRTGLAVVRVSEPDVAREGLLRAAEAEAKGAGRGLWDPTACGPAPNGAADLRIVGLHLDAPGDDSLNLDNEWVDLRNEGSQPVDLTGWRLRDESASHRFSFPTGFVLAPGADVRIRSGCGPPTATELHWCAQGSAIWNNDGDTAFLLDPSGNVVTSFAA